MPRSSSTSTAVAVARLVMGPHMRIQVPPNLSDPAEFDLLVRAGADDWGGVSPLTADHVNPERPWPHLDDLAARTAELGFDLRERLTAHPEFVRDADAWIDPALHAAVAALADPETGLAPIGSAAALRQAQGPLTSRTAASRSLSLSKRPATPLDRRERTIRRLAEAAASDPLALDDAEWVALLEATGDDLDALTATADDVRRYTVGEAVSLVVNRNLTSSGFRTTPDRRPGRPSPSTTSARSPPTRGSSARPSSACRASSRPRSPRTRTSRSPAR